ncbi:MAG: hypothetical protein NE327_22685 [Lentisphaeraceae bacterium]|nr:hypothetical protein [Lentisphaeraceae bacterium]
MKLLIVITLFLLTACSSYVSPEETVAQSIEAAKEGDAEKRWELSSKASREKLLKEKTKEEVLNNFKNEAFMYKLIRSWKTETVSQSEDKVTLNLHYKFFDPHSKRELDETSKIKLVKEDGLWRIED